MNDPDEKQILSALSESGFLFEQECATAIESLGFHVETSWPFADQEAGKSRELDLRALRRVHVDEGSKLQVFVELLIECKDFEAPLVFIEREKNKREIENPKPNEYRFPQTHYHQQLTEHSFREVGGFEYFGLAKQHYYYRETKKTTQFAKIVRKGSQWVANHDGVHDAIVLPLAKALEARKAAIPRPSTRREDWASIWLFFPVVLVRSRLIAHRNASDKPLEDRKRVSYVRGLETEHLKGSYLIDFVRLDALHSYINEEVLTFSAAAQDLVVNRSAELRGSR